MQQNEGKIVPVLEQENNA